MARNSSMLFGSMPPAEKKICHCEPVRRLVWQSPRLYRKRCNYSSEKLGDCHVASLLAMTSVSLRKPEHLRQALKPQLHVAVSEHGDTVQNGAAEDFAFLLARQEGVYLAGEGLL